MKALILEDELIATNRLKRIISDVDKSIEILASFESVYDMAQYMLTHPMPDILFLDVQVMDGLSFELFDIIDIQSAVIFTTAFDEYAVQAFRKNAVDYLLKPIKKADLSEALKRVKKIRHSQIELIEKSLTSYKNRFLIRFGSKLYSIPVTDIAYIYSENKISYFILNDGKRVPSDFKLKELITQLDPRYFYRVNRQFIIHLSSIKSMNTYSKSRIKLTLEPVSPNEVIISTETTPKFKSWLNR